MFSNLKFASGILVNRMDFPPSPVLLTLTLVFGIYTLNIYTIHVCFRPLKKLTSKERVASLIRSEFNSGISGESKSKKKRKKKKGNTEKTDVTEG